MSARLDKLGAEWDRALKKAAEWAAKAKELERRYKELENTEIHDLVHAAEALLLTRRTTNRYNEIQGGFFHPVHRKVGDNQPLL